GSVKRGSGKGLNPSARPPGRSGDAGTGDGRARRRATERVPADVSPGRAWAGAGAEAVQPADGEVIVGRQAVREALRAGRAIHRLMLRRGVDERTRAEFIALA